MDGSGNLIEAALLLLLLLLQPWPSTLQ